MLLSKLLYKTQKNIPTDEVSLNAKLLLQACYVKKEIAGVFSYLPLGLKVISKIEKIVKEEMNAVGGQEVLMPGLTPKQNWLDTGRWDMDVLFKTTGITGSEYALGATHEEMVTPIAKQFINSYKDLPLSIYQIQTKFRNEERAKSGILRCREFKMKDMYSFHETESDFEQYYEKVKQAYINVYNRLGIGSNTIVALADGGAFTDKLSHEFQTFTEAGEDLIYVCEKCHTGLNKEVIEKFDYSCNLCGNKDLITKKAIEVGNIFSLETKYSKAFDLTFQDKEGNKKNPIMGCYGIGITRVMGAIVEVSHDDNGIIWPESIAPFAYQIVALGNSESVISKSNEIYNSLTSKGFDCLLDDRDESAGTKLKDADLIGCPKIIIVGDRNLSENKIEIKTRKTNEIESKDVAEFLK